MAEQSIEELDENLKPKRVEGDDDMLWLPATDPRLNVQGLAWWHENGGRFSRLPLRAEGQVRDAVWQLAQCPASARIAFRTDSTRIAARVTNNDASVMPHMPGSGSNGLSLYCGEPYRMRYWATATPDQTNRSFTSSMVKDLAPQMREYRLYLPLYKALESLEIGLSPGAVIADPSPASLPKPVVIYGTSITQGGCASTSGADHVSTVGRMLNLDMINLGFSGNGKGEPELAEMISEIDAAMYIVDYAGNVELDELIATMPRFLDILREKRPHTPIALVTNIMYAQYIFSAEWFRLVEGHRDVIMEYYLDRRKSGDDNIHFIDGSALLPFNTDAATVDGGHPTDRGFRIMAERLAPFVEQILLRDPAAGTA